MKASNIILDAWSTRYGLLWSTLHFKLYHGWEQYKIPRCYQRWSCV